MIAMVATELARFVYNEVTRDAPAEEGADFSEQSHKLEKVFDALANSKANLFLIDIDALPFDAEDIVERLTERCHKSACHHLRQRVSANVQHHRSPTVAGI